MNNRIPVLSVLLGVLLAIVGCAKPSQQNQPTTNLAKAHVLQIAEVAAKSEGFDIEKYNMTGCHYEYTDKDKTWTVFYELKPPTPPGGHFLVSVDDQTKTATLARGE